MVTRGFASCLAACALATLFSTAPTVRAGGFQIPTQSARAAGQADAFTAQADDPSAIYYNPAGLTQLTGTQLSAGLYTVLPGFHFSSPAGDADNHEPAYIPHFYLASDLGQKDWRVGFGINSVFGLRENWGGNSPLRQAVTSADLDVLNFAPAISYRIDEHWSLGTALNAYYGTLELKNAIPLPAGPEGDFRIEGDGWAVGATVGTLWKINDQHSLGLVYRSPFRINFDGSARIDIPGAPTVGPSDTRAAVDFPQIIVAGYAFRPTRQLTLEADLQWADWNTLNEVAVQSKDPRFSSLPPRAFDFQSSFTYRLGMQYQLDRSWALRGGYIYSPTSSPSRTFTPAVVDLDSHIFTLGLGYAQPKWSLDLAYRFILGPQRKVDESINSPPGDYTDISHAFILTLTLKL